MSEPGDRDDTHATGSPQAEPAAVDLGSTAAVPEVDPRGSTAPRGTAKLLVREPGGREAEEFARAGYTLQGVLGRGGMGVVHKAWDARLQRHVAIKVTHEGVRLGEVQLERFRREAIAAARVEHPGIVAVHGSGEVDGRPYLVLELVTGKSLADALKEAPLPPRDLAAIVRDVALALQHVHELGIVHRDVKPENVLLDGPLPGGRPKLADFGLARDPAATEQLTSTGDVMGTPAYMAPEQARGESSAQGPCTDVYGLGGILYRALTGRVPFQAASAPAVLKKILHDEPPPLRSLNPSVHVDLETITLRCLQKEPERRYLTAAAVADDLARYLAGEPILARPVSSAERAWMWLRRNARAVGGVALVVAVAAGLTAGGIALARGRAEEREAERRARSLAAAIERARSELLVEGSAERRAVADALAGEGGPAGVAALGAALDALTERLRGVTRDLLLAAGTPTVEEREAGGVELEGLAAAIERHLSRAPGARSDAETLTLIGAAERRLEARADARRPGSVFGTAPEARLLVAGAQERALGVPGAQEARLLCEALGRVGGADAVPALARYLAVEEGETRATAAAEALCAIGTHEALRAVQVRAQEFGPGLLQQRIARLFPGQSESGAGFAAHLQEGVARLAADDFPGAIAALTSALALDPGSAEAWSQRAMARREHGEERAAIEDATRALELDPRSLRAHMARAGAYLALGEPEAAIASVESAVALAPRSPDALTMRGETRLGARDLRGAQADFEVAVALDPRSGAAWFGLGTARHQLGDAEGALAHFDRALEHDPSLWMAWLNRGTLRGRRGDLPGALADLTRAIDLRPTFAHAWSNRGTIKRSLGDVDGAIADLRCALELLPDEPAFTMNLALSLLDRGDLDGALAAADRSIALAPDRPDAWSTRSTIRRARGDHGGALEDMTRAIELDPRDISSWFTRAHARRRQGDLQGAEADFTKALELAPHGFRIWNARANVRARRDDLQGALADHDRALAIEPAWAEAYAERAEVKERLEDLDGALADYTKASELAPAMPWAWGGRGRVHMLRFEFQAALAAYDRTVELIPRDPGVRFRRSDCRAQLGDVPGAIADLELYLELAPPGDPGRRPAAKELERLRREAR